MIWLRHELVWHSYKPHTCDHDLTQKSCKTHTDINAAAWLVHSLWKYDSVAPLLRDLYWLQMPQWIEYKLQSLPTTLCVVCCHLTSPRNCHVANIDSQRHLRLVMMNKLVVPRMRRSTFSDCDFPVVTALYPVSRHCRHWPHSNENSRLYCLAEATQWVSAMFDQLFNVFCTDDILFCVTAWCHSCLLM